MHHVLFSLISVSFSPVFSIFLPFLYLLFNLTPLHPSVTYIYISLYWRFFLSKEQIDQWNVTEPNVEEDAKSNDRSSLYWCGPQQELGLPMDG
jgi:hypothetical protein